MRKKAQFTIDVNGQNAKQVYLGVEPVRVVFKRFIGAEVEGKGLSSLEVVYVFDTNHTGVYRVEDEPSGFRDRDKLIVKREKDVRYVVFIQDSETVPSVKEDLPGLSAGKRTVTISANVPPKDEKRSELRTTQTHSNPFDLSAAAASRASLIGFRDLEGVTPLPTEGEMNADYLKKIMEQALKLFPDYEEVITPIFKTITHSYYADPASMERLLTIRDDDGAVVLYVHSSLKPKDENDKNPARDQLVAWLLGRALIARALKLHEQKPSLSEEVALFFALDIPFWNSLKPKQQTALMAVSEAKPYLELLKKYTKAKDEAKTWKQVATDFTKTLGAHASNFEPQVFSGVRSGVKKLSAMKPAVPKVSKEVTFDQVAPESLKDRLKDKPLLQRLVMQIVTTTDRVKLEGRGSKSLNLEVDGLPKTEGSKFLDLGTVLIGDHFASNNLIRLKRYAQHASGLYPEAHYTDLTDNETHPSSITYFNSHFRSLATADEMSQMKAQLKKTQKTQASKSTDLDLAKKLAPLVKRLRDKPILQRVIELVIKNDKEGLKDHLLHSSSHLDAADPDNDRLLREVFGLAPIEDIQNAVGQLCYVTEPFFTQLVIVTKTEPDKEPYDKRVRGKIVMSNDEKAYVFDEKHAHVIATAEELAALKTNPDLAREILTGAKSDKDELVPSDLSILGMPKKSVEILRERGITTVQQLKRAMATIDSWREMTGDLSPLDRYTKPIFAAMKRYQKLEDEIRTAIAHIKVRGQFVAPAQMVEAITEIVNQGRSKKISQQVVEATLQENAEIKKFSETSPVNLFDPLLGRLAKKPFLKLAVRLMIQGKLAELGLHLYRFADDFQIEIQALPRFTSIDPVKERQVHGMLRTSHSNKPLVVVDRIEYDDATGKPSGIVYLKVNDSQEIYSATPKQVIREDALVITGDELEYWKAWFANDPENALKALMGSEPLIKVNLDPVFYGPKAQEFVDLLTSPDLTAGKKAEIFGEIDQFIQGMNDSAYLDRFVKEVIEAARSQGVPLPMPLVEFLEKLASDQSVGERFKVTKTIKLIEKAAREARAARSSSGASDSSVLASGKGRATPAKTRSELRRVQTKKPLDRNFQSSGLPYSSKPVTDEEAKISLSALALNVNYKDGQPPLTKEGKLTDNETTLPGIEPGPASSSLKRSDPIELQGRSHRGKYTKILNISQEKIDLNTLQVRLIIAREAAERILREEDFDAGFDAQFLLEQLMPDAFVKVPDVLSDDVVEQISAVVANPEGVKQSSNREIASSDALPARPHNDLMSENGFVDLSSSDALFAGKPGEVLFRDLAKLLVRFKRADGRPWLTIIGADANRLSKSALEAGISPSDLYRTVKFRTDQPFETAAKQDGDKFGAAILAPNADQIANLSRLLLFVGDSQGFEQLDHIQKVTTAFSLIIALNHVSAYVKSQSKTDDVTALVRDYLAKELPGLSIQNQNGYFAVAYSAFWQYLETLPEIQKALSVSA